MARQGNLFAVLDGEEDDEVSMLIESIAAKVEVSSRSSTAGKNGKKHPPPDSVRGGRGRGNGGLGFYSKRNNGNDADQFGNSRLNGYLPENGRADGNRYRATGNADGDQYHAKGRADGDHQDNGRADGDEGWVEVFRNKEGRPFQDDVQFTSRNRNYRGERPGYDYVNNRVPRSQRGHDADNNNSETKGNGSATTKVYEEENQQRKHKEEQKQKDEERKRKEEERKLEKELYEERKWQREEDAKKMTLKQYAEIIEKNKALGVSKSHERKVTLDKDFESMHVVTKNKEGDIFIKLNSDKEKLKKKDSVVKDTKMRKMISIDEFLKQQEAEKNVEAEWKKPDSGSRWNGSRDGGSRGELNSLPAMKPTIEDLHLFPTLYKVAKPRT